VGSIHPYSSAKGKRYEVRYRKPNGLQGAKRGFVRKRDAEIWLAELDSARARGGYIDPQAAKVTVGSLGPTWLAAKEVSLKPSSFAPIETAWRIRVLPTWGGWQIADIKFTDVKAWVARLQTDVGATVTIRTFGVLASILDDAVADNRIANNPARAGKVGLPRKLKKKHVYLSHDEVVRLAQSAGERRLLVLLLAYTGIRWAEATGLTIASIDVQRARLHVTSNAVEVHGRVHVGTPKSHHSRLVPIPRFLVDELRSAVAGRRPTELLFARPDGSHMRRVRTSTDSKSWFKSALQDAGLPLMTIHDLRHTAASLAVQSGANVKLIQRMLGHASAAMTLDVYADLFDDDLDIVSRALDDRARRSGVASSYPGDSACPSDGYRTR
jgi:integrase